MTNRNSSRSAWTVQLLCSTALALVLSCVANANPQDGRVAAGTATIVQTNPQTLSVNQMTQKAVINWQSFSIGQGETTNFLQPSASAITLNRVTGVDPSTIMGNLTANGQVWLINPNGIAFGKTARVDVAGLLATTIDIADHDFMSGNYRFSGLSNPSAMVSNAGQITVRNAGLAALVAPGVENSGLIQANLGQIQLSSAAAFTVDLYGDGLFNFTLDKQVTQSIKKPDGTKPVAAVSNSGQLIANGGRILLTANAAKSVVDHAINMSGYAQATSASVSSTGEIVLDGGSEGVVRVAGAMDTSGQGGANGGTVRISGQDVQLSSSSKIDASGASGGSVSVISQGNATAAGTIVARNTNSAKKGGTVETSGHELSVSGSVDAGQGGSWLLDPYDLTVDTSAAATINNALNAGTNTTLKTTAGSANGPGVQNPSGYGDITIASALSWSGSGILTLDAYRSIAINSDIAITGNGGLVLTTNDGGIGGDYAFNNAHVAFTNPLGGSSQGSLTIDGHSYTLIGSMTELQNVNTNLVGFYALANSLDASSTSKWTPIGNTDGDVVLNSGNGFGGAFEGLGNTISNLKVGYGADYSGLYFYAGLFGYSTGSIRDVGIVGGWYIGTGRYVGWLVGYNKGSVSNSFSTGELRARDYSGGLVGRNDGTITNSYATGIVTSTYSTGSGPIGGLVGENSGTITRSYATGTVNGGRDLGGLVGVNEVGGSISESYATSTVNNTKGSYCCYYDFGGLVGNNWGNIDRSYATGQVNGGSDYVVGGLAGANHGAITDSYSTGAISGANYVGGLVGGNGTGGTISKSYSVGTVTVAAGGIAGGFLADNSGYVGGSGGTVIQGYWDTQSSGRSVGIGQGDASGVTGLTTIQLKSGLPSGFDPAIWSSEASANGGYPSLKWQNPGTVPPPPPPVGGTVTWSVASVSSTYGTLATLGDATLTGVAAADTSNVQYTLGLFLDSNGASSVTLSPSLNAGTYYEGVTALTGTAAGIYTLASTGNTYGILTINPKMLTWKTTDYSSTYGTLGTLPTATLTGVLASDLNNVNPVIGLVANGSVISLSATTSAGSYSETVRSLIGSAAGNYTLSTSGNTAGTFVVNPKPLSWSVADASYAYGSSPNIGEATLTGIVGNDKVDGLVGFFSGTTAVAITSTTPLGSYTEKVVALTNTEAHNYTLASSGNSPGTLTVQLSKTDSTQASQAQSQTASALLAWNSFLASFNGAGGKIEQIWTSLESGIAKWLGLTSDVPTETTVQVPSVRVIQTSAPPPAASTVGDVRGKLQVELPDGRTVDVIAYSNGSHEGSTNPNLAPNQCTDLIVRYAQQIGLSGISTTGDTGNGMDAARNFAAKSGGAFTFINGQNATSLPLPGAVLSIGNTMTDGTPWSINPYGHVAIVQKVVINGDVATVTIFDQNYPTSQWKTVTLTKSADGTWSGYLPNTPPSTGIQQRISIAGWANPSGPG